MQGAHLGFETERKFYSEHYKTRQMSSEFIQKTEVIPRDGNGTYPVIYDHVYVCVGQQVARLCADVPGQ